MKPKKLLRINFDQEDLALLNECSKIEKLNWSEVIRRAVRAFHKSLKEQQSNEPSSNL